MTASTQPETAEHSLQDRLFAIYDRLSRHGHCAPDVVLVPATADGTPDYAKADPANIEALPNDNWPADEMAAERAVVLVDLVDGCHEDSSFILFMQNDEPQMVQIHGPEADRVVAESIIARDVELRPVVRPPSKLAASFRALMSEGAAAPLTDAQAAGLREIAERFESRPAAANDNTPPYDERLIPYLAAFGGPDAVIVNERIYGAMMGGSKGTISLIDGKALFTDKHTSRFISLPPKPKDRFSVDWFGDIEEDQAKEEILKGVFGCDEYTMVSGKPGSGKSVITTDIACHIAAGMSWHGRPVKQGLVVYVAAERKALTKRRMMAFRKHHDVGDIPLIVVGGMLDLTSGLTDAHALTALIKAAEEKAGLPCVWIIIDTLTRTFGPGDQNASKDMTKFVQACDTIREGVTGTHLTVVHHTGWAGDRGKGAIDLDGAVDASFLVKKQGGVYTLECDGTNDGDEGVITHFRMEGVQVGMKDGDPTMAPVVVPADGIAPGEQLVAAVKGHALKALEVLRKLGEGGATVPQGLWRSGFYAEYHGVDTETLKSRFRRAKDSLLKAETIAESAEGFSLAS